MWKLKHSKLFASFPPHFLHYDGSSMEFTFQIFRRRQKQSTKKMWVTGPNLLLLCFIHGMWNAKKHIVCNTNYDICIKWRRFVFSNLNLMGSNIVSVCKVIPLCAKANDWWCFNILMVKFIYALHMVAVNLPKYECSCDLVHGDGVAESGSIKSTFAINFSFHVELHYY